MADIVATFEPDARAWSAVNDGVMGGVSSGRMRPAERSMVFEGHLSMENNGGFASVRRGVDAALDNAERVRLRFRGDGRRYQLRIRQDSRFDGVAWRAMLPPATPEWRTVELALSDFEPVFRGRTVAAAGPVQAGRIRQLGFLLADKQEGPFRLEVAEIEFLTAARPDPE